MHIFVCREPPQLHYFDWLPAVALQYDIGQRQLADTHAIHFLDTLGSPCLLQCHGLLAHTTFGLYLHNQPVDVLHDELFRLCTHTEHAHGPAYETSLPLEFRLQLAHVILVQVLAAQRCESITGGTGERRQVMERCQDAFRRDGRS